MNNDDIKVGKTYTNGRGRFRKVTRNTTEPFWLEYFAWKTLKRGIVIDAGPSWRNGPMRMTKRAFAVWAKRAATTDEVATLP